MRRALGRTRVRLTLAYTALLAVLAFGCASGVWLTLRGGEYSTIDHDLQTEAQDLVSGISDNHGQILFETGDRVPPQTSGGNAVRATVVVGGHVAASLGSPPSASAAVAAAAALGGGPGPALSTINEGGSDQRLAAIAVQGLPGVTLVVARDLTQVNQRVASDALLLLAGAAVLVVGASLLGYQLAGRALRPVGHIAAIARAVKDQDLRGRVDLSLPDDELGELAATFNEMLDRLESAFNALRQFTADAAHELRAPLALMRTELEVALARSRRPDVDADTLRSLLAEVERLAGTADGLLLLARADAGALKPERTRVDVVDLLEETASRWHTYAQTRDVSIAVDTPSTGWLRGDAGMLGRVLDNLVDNAVRHSPPHESVTLTAAHADSSWSITVSDRGPGFPPELRSRLFARFTRADRARGRGTGGAGLGLALVKAVVDAHDGSVSASSAPGALVRITLPDA